MPEYEESEDATMQRVGPDLIYAPRIDLQVTHDRGDLGPRWEHDTKFSDHTTRFEFRWRFNGPAVAGAAYTVHDRAGPMLESETLEQAPGRQEGGFWLKLSELPERKAYEVRVHRLDDEGASVGEPSNAVGLAHSEVVQPPFLFIDLSIDDLRQQREVPGLVAAVSCRAGDFREFATGVRRVDAGRKVDRGDLWHLGSCTKAFTATLIGLLVQDGLLDWETTLGALASSTFGGLLSDVNLHPAMAAVTIEQLACHRTGMAMTGPEDRPTRNTANYSRDPVEFRAETVLPLLERDHPGEPGQWRYGQGNYMLLGVLIERILGVPYEQAMHERLLDPLGASTAMFGMPTDLALPADLVDYPFSSAADVARRVDTTIQPNGHLVDGMVVDNLALPPVWNPAGGLAMSMADWNRFLRLHVDGTSGDLTMQSHILNRLHSAYTKDDRVPGPVGSSKPEDPTYGWGWGIGMTSGVGRVLGHDGTYFRFYSSTALFLDRGDVAMAVANVGCPFSTASGIFNRGQAAVGDAVNLLAGEAPAQCAKTEPVVLPGVFRRSGHGGQTDRTWRRHTSEPDSDIHRFDFDAVDVVSARRT